MPAPQDPVQLLPTGNGRVVSRRCSATAAGDIGRACWSSAAAPATKGVAMLVP
jgi:hypothetical protein